ncbi:MAG: hypothetical protein ACXVHJ_12210 [Solirubrobacteraceae bacterium]
MVKSAGSTPSSRHPLVPPTATPEPAPTARVAAGPAWPTYTGTAQRVGTSTSGVSVYVDPSLGQAALRNAQDLLADADRVVQANSTIFNIAGEPVDVVVFALGGHTDGTGGADHGGCTFTNGNAIEVDASFGNPARVSALFEAELSECAMNGQLCGESTGEALSRWCAAVVGNNALADYATAPVWAQDGMPDWVDQTEPTDQGADSTGCGMAFLSWVLSQGHSLAEVAQAMVALGDSGTLAQLYSQLTGNPTSDAWSRFTAAIDTLPGGVTSDDPFNALGTIGTSPTTPG